MQKNIAHDFLRNEYPILTEDVVESENYEDISSQLLITETNGEYRWTSHDDLRLRKKIHDIRMEFPKETIPDDASETVTVTVFESLDTKELVFIVHLPPETLEPGCPQHYLSKCAKTGCFRFGSNYVEIVLKDENLVIRRIGKTDPFPYPEPDICNVPEKGHGKAILKETQFGEPEDK